jgi:uncharacterized protein YdaU (DUF1376 family)
MGDSPFVAFYTSDFLAGTAGMTAAEKGVYITLLCLMYETEEPLNYRMDTLARRCGCRTVPALEKILEVLEEDGKIERLEEGIWSDKVSKHIVSRHERRRQGVVAAETRWKKTKEKQSSKDAGAMPEQCQPEPESDNKSLRLCVDHSTRDAQFEDFWENFPHRGGVKRDRAKAKKKWDLIARGNRVDLSFIVERAKLYRGDGAVLAGFGKGPVPWLNGQCWDDEIEPPRQQKTPGAGAGGDREAQIAYFKRVAAQQYPDD